MYKETITTERVQVSKREDVQFSKLSADSEGKSVDSFRNGWCVPVREKEKYVEAFDAAFEESIQINTEPLFNCNRKLWIGHQSLRFAYYAYKRLYEGEIYNEDKMYQLTSKISRYWVVKCNQIKIYNNKLSTDLIRFHVLKQKVSN